ncbi:MAG: hypothetical protein DI570_22490 [Phenylobacterium zucineum]|nr:MAG: hypothetical protein DI570_22490 [Phenylobacterium zucineum]
MLIEEDSMPITDDREYEAALEEAVQLLEACEGREAGNARLLQLLGEIEGYRPMFDLDAPPVDPHAAKVQALIAQAERLRKRVERSGYGGLPEHGPGMGPTTGAQRA